MEFNGLLKRTLAEYTSGTEFTWLEKAVSLGGENEGLLQLAFVAVPRYIDKKSVALDEGTKDLFLKDAGFSPDGWSLPKLARLYILMHFKPGDEKKYVRTLTTLFETAELNELATLHASLSLLYYPESWLYFAKEGVRSNMGVVFDSIAFNNPYPSKHFDEPAWNQMVLKTIFSGKSIHNIYGLEKRANRELAYMISDFAHERWAAGRPISPQVWELVGPFIDEHLLPDMETLFNSGNSQERYAAIMACQQSNYAPAKELLKKFKIAPEKKGMARTQ
jgi:hypothetical protein